MVDAEPYSCDYGKVIWTAELPNIAQSFPTPSTARHIEPQHQLAYTSYTNPNTRRKFLHTGGLISNSVFRYDITALRGAILTAEVAVCNRQPVQSTATGDFIVMPNGNIMYTYMGSSNWGPNTLGEGTGFGGGTVTEINPLRVAPTVSGVTCRFPPVGSSEIIGNANYLGEYHLAPGTGPSAVVPRAGVLSTDDQLIRSGTPNKGQAYFGNKNAAKEAHPHGIALTYDAVYLVTADYAVPRSIGITTNPALPLGAPQAGVGLSPANLRSYGTFGSSVRVMRVNPATLNTPAFGGYTPDAGGTGYFNPPSITYGGAESGMHALAGPPNGPVAAYIHSISVVPDGPRREPSAIYEENEGVIGLALPHQAHHCPGQAGWDPGPGPGAVFGDGNDGIGNALCAPAMRIPHDGAFTNSMCGGSLFYTPNIRLPQSTNGGTGPIWNGVYDAGPCTGLARSVALDDDRFLILPIAGHHAPLTFPPVFDRDYAREHSRRVLVLDVRPLINQGNGISHDTNSDGDVNEADLTLVVGPATYAHPVNCHFPTRSNAAAGGNLGLPLAASVDRVITPAGYVAEVGLMPPLAAPLNILIHNNLASDCPRVVGVVGQFEDGVSPTRTTLDQPLAAGVVTVGDTGDPGVGYPQSTFCNGAAGVSAAQAGGHPIGPPIGPPTTADTGNLNTPQNLNTCGGPHFSNFDRIGFCVPRGADSGVAICADGSYYDLRPELTGAPRKVYPASAAAAADCKAGTTAYNGTDPGAPSALVVDPNCVVRVGFSQYYAQLNHVPAKGSGIDGDRTLCMMLVNRVTGAATLDPSFKDELKNLSCLDFDSAAREAYPWPGARGVKGGAKVRSFSFERDGANAIGPGYFPPASLNLKLPEFELQ